MAIGKNVAIPQGFYRSFQDDVEITDEKAGQVIDYSL
jgi:hypothetical protein